MSTPTDIHNLAPQLREVLDSKDWPALEARVSPAIISHVGGQDLDKNAWIAMGKMFYEAFPDGQHRFTRELAQGDTSVAIGAFEGTHRGSFMGILPTGRRVSVKCILVDRFQDGFLVEHWGQFDSAGMMQQLTAKP